ncbi:MAG: glycosyltransferase family 9 protein, partial [Verrucomicrobiota bacterium]
MKSILVIRLKAIGDVVLTLPAVNAVRQNFPNAKITFLTSKENAALLQGFREVNEVISLDRAALRSGNPLKVVRVFFRMLHQLRKGKFDLVVDLHGYGETAWLARITGAPQRWCGVHRTGHLWAYTRRIAPVSAIHAAQWHLQTLQACGLEIGTIRNEFVLPESALRDARVWFDQHELNPVNPTLYLQPFTSGAHKNWPLENYLAVARHWRQQGVQI